MVEETPAAGRELEVTWKRVRFVAWLICWRVGLVGVGGVVVINMASTTVLQELLIGDKSIWFAPIWSLMALIVPYIWLFFSFLWVTRAALRKQYKTFRIALVRVIADAGIWPNTGEMT